MSLSEPRAMCGTALRAFHTYLYRHAHPSRWLRMSSCLRRGWVVTERCWLLLKSCDHRASVCPQGAPFHFFPLYIKLPVGASSNAVSINARVHVGVQAHTLTLVLTRVEDRPAPYSLGDSALLQASTARYWLLDSAVASRQPVAVEGTGFSATETWFWILVLQLMSYVAESMSQNLAECQVPQLEHENNERESPYGAVMRIWDNRCANFLSCSCSVVDGQWNWAFWKLLCNWKQIHGRESSKGLWAVFLKSHSLRKEFQFYLWPVVGSQANYLISLSLSFLICKIETISLLSLLSSWACCGE